MLSRSRSAPKNSTALLWGERSARWEQRQLGPNRDDYQLRIGVGQVLGMLYETDPDLFARVIERYLRKGDFLQLQPGWIVPRLVAAVGDRRAAGILETTAIPQSAQWWFAFFMALAPETITSDWRDRLLKLYEDAPVEALPQDLDYLQRYEGIDTSIVKRVTAILVARAQQDERIGLALAGLTGHGPLSGRLLELFTKDPQLLEQAYFAASKAEPHADYDAKGFSILLDFDPTFGARWVEWMADQKEWLSRYDDNRHYQALWLRDDYLEVFRALLTKLYDLSEAKPLSMFRYPQVFFILADGAPSGNTDKIRQRQDALLLAMLEERARDFAFVEFLFEIVRDLGAERRRAFVAAFVKWNKRFEDFKRLPLEPSMWEWSGSRVPMYQAMVDFYESLLPALDNEGLLDHKLLAERQIADLRQTIETEKRKDFMGQD